MATNTVSNTFKETKTGDQIEIPALYILVTQNNVQQNVLGSVLYHNYLNNSLNAGLVKSYSRVEGEWYNVFFKGVKVFCVYAIDESDALNKRKDDLNNLGYVNSQHLSAKLDKEQKAA